jgi:hypothetical protein
MLRWTRNSLFPTLSRDRVQRRMIPEALDQLESSIKLSKIPEGFVTFDDIENLRCRELAYTAHIASRSNMENEKLWERITQTFIQSVDHEAMTPKYLTQTLVAVKRSSVSLDSGKVSRIISAILKKIHEYKLTDLVLVINSLDIPCHRVGPFVDAIFKKITFASESTKTLALLCSGLGQLGVYDGRIIGIKDTRISNETELAVIVRYLSKCELPVEIISEIILTNSHITLSPSSLNIIFRAVSDKVVGKDLVDFLILERLSGISFLAFADNPDLIPHLFYFSARLSSDDQHLAVVLRLATRVARNYSEYKAVALPLVVEGLNMLSTKFSNNKNVSVLVNQLSPISDLVVDRFMLVAPLEEKIRTLSSSYTLYCPKLKVRLEAEMVRGPLIPSSPELTLEECAANVLADIRIGKRCVGVERIEKLVKEYDEPFFSNEFFSLFFRIVAARPTLMGKETLDRIGSEFMEVMDKAPVKTVIRFMQLRQGREGAEKSFEAVASRIHEVDSEEMIIFLTLVDKFGFSLEHSLYFDEVEAKVSSTLGKMKSVHAREDLVALAKRVGLSDPEDIIDGYEQELCVANRKTRS